MVDNLTYLVNLVNIRGCEMSRVLGFSEAKAALSTVFDDVERSAVRVVRRRKSATVALLRQDELGELLAEHYPFTVAVSRADDGTVSVWLDQLAIYGRGPSIQSAADDLLDEVEEYVEEWEERLHLAPNHSARRWWVHRVQMAADRDELRSMIFASPKA